MGGASVPRGKKKASVPTGSHSEADHRATERNMRAAVTDPYRPRVPEGGALNTDIYRKHVQGRKPAVRGWIPWLN